MQVNEFIEKLRDIAEHYKTAYVQCCFGAPMNAKNRKRYASESSYNKKHADEILALPSDVFGFDCVCLIKGVLWGWCGDASKTYGGAKYASNGVPDIGTEQLIEACAEVSTDFDGIELGELVWMPGHVGIYIGDGNVIECTPKWNGGVQFSKLGNGYSYASGHYRVWNKHGKLPYIDYPQSDKLFYTVKRGDCLWNIAQSLLGSGKRYPEIMKLNNLKGSDIRPGQVLRIK